jgi:hypothetical protein
MAVLAIFLGWASVSPAEELSTLLGNGATWRLTLDDWDGQMVVSKAEYNSSDAALKVLNASVVWLGVRGTIEAREYTDGSRRSVHLVLATPDGSRFEADGMLAYEADRFMAGETRYSGRQAGHTGAWYATSMSPGSSAMRMVTPSTGVVSNAAVQTAVAQGRCTIQGEVAGGRKLVGSVTVSPDGTTPGERKDLKPDSAGGYRIADLVPGRYRVTVNPSGKFALIGEGIDRTVDCPAGETLSLQTSIARAAE